MDVNQALMIHAHLCTGLASSTSTHDRILPDSENNVADNSELFLHKHLHVGTNKAILNTLIHCQKQEKGALVAIAKKAAMMP